MIFGSPNNDPKQNSGTKKPPGKTRQTLNYLFNPQLGESIRPIGQSWQMFLQLIAMLFAANRLFPRNHPVLLGNQQVRLTLGEIIHTAWSQLEFKKENTPQILMFFAITGTIFFVFFALFVSLLSVFVGTAHAQSMFTVPNPQKDLGQASIKYLFLGDESWLAGFSTAISSAKDIVATFLKLLGTYSKIILVVAGIVLLYHLISMIAETAHTGKPMGQANQIWAPIRLVVAIGLLVPIGSSLNTGQYIVIKASEWGSGVASNLWGQFIDGMGANFKKPAPPQIENATRLVVSAYLMEACKEIHDQYRNASLGSVIGSTVGTIGSIKKINTVSNQFSVERWQYKNNLDPDVPACGQYIFSRASNARAPGPLPKLSAELSSQSKDIVDDLIITTNSWVKRNRLINWYVTTNTPSGTPPDDPNLIQDIQNKAKEIENKINTKISIALNEGEAAFSTSLNESKTMGWMSAGSYILQMARFQGLLGDIAKNSLPVAEGPELAYGIGNTERLRNRIYNDGTWLGLAFNSSTSRVQGVKDFVNSANDRLGIFKSWLDAKLSAANINTSQFINIRSNQSLDSNPRGVLFVISRLIDDAAQWAGLWGSSSGAGTFVGNTQPELGITFSSNNPIAELNEFGIRNVTLGFYLYGVAAVAQASSAIPYVGGLISALSPIIAFVGTICFAGGFVLAFLLPILPFLRFFFAILTWLLQIFEAIISVPLVALAHLDPKGDGLGGRLGTNAYLLWFNIMLSPMLMVFGLIVGLVFFSFAINFLNIAFLKATTSSGSWNSELFILTKVFYTVIYAALAYIAANSCFKGIGFFTQNALRWLGTSPHLEKMGDTAQIGSATAAVAAYGGTQIAKGFQSAGAVGGKMLGGGLDSWREDKGKARGVNRWTKESEQEYLDSNGESGAPDRPKIDGFLGHLSEDRRKAVKAEQAGYDAKQNTLDAKLGRKALSGENSSQRNNNSDDNISAPISVEATSLNNPAETNKTDLSSRMDKIEKDSENSKTLAESATKDARAAQSDARESISTTSQLKYDDKGRSPFLQRLADNKDNPNLGNKSFPKK